MPEPGATSERLELLKARWEADRGSRVFLQLADEYRRLGRIEEAAQVLEEGLEATPRHTAAQVALGRCQLELGRTDAAVATLEAVLESDPTQMVAYRLLVEAYLAQGKAEEARERLRFYTLLNDADPEIAELRRRIGELDRGSRRTAPPPREAGPDDTGDETWSSREAAEDAPPEPPAAVEAEEEPAGVREEPFDVEPASADEGDRSPGAGEPPGAEASPEAPENGAPGPSPSPSDPFPDLSETLYRRRVQEAAPEGDLFAPEIGDREPEDTVVPGFPDAPAERADEAGPARNGAPTAPGDAAAGDDPFELPPPPPPPAQDLAELLGTGDRSAPREREAPEPAAGDESPRPTVTLGRLYLRQGHAAEAESIFRAVLDRDPANPEARRHLEELARAPAPGLEAGELLEGYAAGERDGLTERKRYVLERYLDRLRGRSAHDVR